MSGDTTQNQLQSTVFVSLSTRKTRKIGKKAPKLTVIEGFALSGIYIKVLVGAKIRKND